SAPTCLRSQVARLATWRAIPMKYSSQELRSRMRGCLRREPFLAAGAHCQRRDREAALAKRRLACLGTLTSPGDETAKAVVLEKGAHLRRGRCEGLPGHRHIEAVRLLGDGEADAGGPISLHDGQKLSARSGIDAPARGPIPDRRVRLEHCRSAALPIPLHL